MNFDYDSEQNDLREAVRGLLARAYSDSEQRRAVVKAEPGFDEKTWSRLAEMGLLGLPFAEEDGGMGAGPVEVAIVAEEIGRVLAPEPFIETVVLAGGLVAAVGTAEQKGELLGGISEGTTIAVFAHAEPAHPLERVGRGRHRHAERRRLDADRRQGAGAQRRARRRPRGQRGRRRRHRPVPRAGRRRRADPHRLPHPRRHPGGEHPLRRHPGRSSSAPAATRPPRSSGRWPRPGSPTATRRSAPWTPRCGTTAEYLKTRKQFGVTLNKFQALTFRAADMYVSLELARSLALWASMVQEAGGDVVSAADRARLQVSRAGRHIGKEAIQLHGGIGVTAEYSVGHYTSRLTAIDHLLGDGDWAAARLAENVGSYETVDPLGAPYA